MWAVPYIYYIYLYSCYTWNSQAMNLHVSFLILKMESAYVTCDLQNWQYCKIAAVKHFSHKFLRHKFCIPVNCSSGLVFVKLSSQVTKLSFFCPQHGHTRHSVWAILNGPYCSKFCIFCAIWAIFQSFDTLNKRTAPNLPTLFQGSDICRDSSFPFCLLLDQL